MKKAHYLYALSFVFALLLFHIKFIIDKIFLLRFDGNYLVWGACIIGGDSLGVRQGRASEKWA